jgi:hypothetical protein
MLPLVTVTGLWIDVHGPKTSSGGRMSAFRSSGTAVGLGEGEGDGEGDGVGVGVGLGVGEGVGVGLGAQNGVKTVSSEYGPETPVEVSPLTRQK